MKYHLQPFDQWLKQKDCQEPIHTMEIMNDMRQTAFKLDTAEGLQLFIKNHQMALSLFKKHASVEKAADEVLFFLETHFSTFISDEVPISDTGWLAFWHSYGPTLVMHREVIKVQSGKWLHDLMGPLLMPEQLKAPTVHQIRYLSEFWDSWPSNDYFKFPNQEKLIGYLICQNYNVPAFFGFIVGGIFAQLSQENTPMASKQLLLGYSHKLNAVLMKEGKPFDLQHPALKPLLQQCLEEELKQCERLVDDMRSAQQLPIARNGSKIETNMPVGQIAYLFRLLFETEAITNKVQMDVLCVLSENFRSKRSDRISIGSLHNKYYEVEGSTRESIQALLQKMLRQTKVS